MTSQRTWKLYLNTNLIAKEDFNHLATSQQQKGMSQATYEAHHSTAVQFEVNNFIKNHKKVDVFALKELTIESGKNARKWKTRRLN